jgi:oxygen-independent coproporphyrinogen-3 oxidase
MMDAYVTKIAQEIEWWGKLLEDNHGTHAPGNVQKQEIKSLYFGGGTPNKIGKHRLYQIIDTVAEHFDLENLGELSIELNPYPEEETLDMIQAVQKKYKKFPRIRRSIGLQTFDSEILKDSGRAYSFPAMVDFLRQLRGIKEMNTVFNFDFIAFGKFNQSKKGNSYLRDEHKQKFFQEFVASGFADGFSLYTLELFSGSEWAKMPDQGWEIFCQQYGSVDDVYDEFARLKDGVLDHNYHRYELSNFASVGRDSIHNRVYRNMENYIGLGTSASSFINFSKGQFGKADITKFAHKLGINLAKDIQAARWTNTFLLGEYLKDNFLDRNKTVFLDRTNYLSEKFFLGLRTNEWVKNIQEFESILEPSWEAKIANFVEQGYCIFDGKKLVLTDEGMDIYNTIVTDIMAQI